MGTWGVKVFDNDSALDWISEIEEEKDLSLVFVKLIEVVKQNSDNIDEALIDADLASEALVSIEIIAALLKKPCCELPQQISKWLKNKKLPDRRLISFFTNLVRDGVMGKDFKIEWKNSTYKEKWNFIVRSLKHYSLQVLEIIKNKSELNELWKEDSISYQNWVNLLKNLYERLNDLEVS